MVVYNFKKITPVPNGREFMDIVLSKTQRKTPTEIHPQYAINRIRRFYMRKVKFCQQAIHDKITLILDEFPRLGDIHPFYEDLMNVLYDKDHYKLALGQLSTCRNLVDAIGRDYVRLLKYGDSLYRCKQLKRAALGRMITVLTKQNSSLIYLEQVRQHLARLPSIDPSSRTLILVGYPNVGKSSFMNNMTRAQVDVQPYPFTTKSLFVGHMEYRYLKWQLIDTPGILDHPLEQRNTIEMQSITAMAHLRSTILYLLDMSETCGYNIQQQCDLFKNVKPLFAGKPVLLVLTKVDLVKYDELSDLHKKMLQEVADMCSDMLAISNIDQSGLNEVKTKACDLLLQNRVEAKMSHGKKSVENILNRVHLALPKKRDDITRVPQIPESVILKRNIENEMEDERITEKHLENEGGGSGVYMPDYKKHYLLKNEEWKYDIIPEFINGKNIADFVDPEIEKRLEELEAEEEERLREEGGFEGGVNYADEEYFVDSDEEDDYQKIVDKKAIIIQTNKYNKNTNHPKLTRKDKPIDLKSIVGELKNRGVPEEALDKARSNSVARTTSSEVLLKSVLLLNMILLILMTLLSFAGIKDPKKQAAAVDLRNKKVKTIQAEGKRAETDHVVYNMMPKHLFSGKTTIGKKDRR
ncbi:predicted protein [Naegleria gruberi]|uniref:Nucleolar GTP-binding protein 1 n=1 Tax=Naegleria gruberi TaxID=5762 RepID=D2VN86_NAEGR|nr:uncharacterized protein NAEGRDRAFT_55845 [Naegleria gruberi]EFC41700.1 predicted protein [Naegleria gruberi]|eukprot:XP_002674444.1 predicted protein [Naegleria gruberi strain NEG-M]